MLRKAIYLVLMIVLSVFSFKSCESAYNYEGDEMIKVRYELVNKHVQVDPKSPDKLIRFVVMKPHIDNPRILDIVVNEDDYRTNNIGASVELEVPKSRASMDYKENYTTIAYTSGFIAFCISYALLWMITFGKTKKNK